MLVTLEGLDGSGKTTVLEALRDAYPDAVFTQEPTDTWTGDAVRRSMGDDDADPVAELFLFTADHAAHLADVVRPALAQGKLVVSDRYSDSRYAYQAATLAGEVDRPMEYVRGIHQPFTRPPDRTVYLEVSPETAVARSDRDDKFETVEHLRAVRDNYERLIDAEAGRFFRVDAENSPESVIDGVEDAMDRWLDD